MTTPNWTDIPHGFYLLRTTAKTDAGILWCDYLSLELKVSDAPWYHQPSVPSYRSDLFGQSSVIDEFWQWAKANLPIWDKGDQ